MPRLPLQAAKASGNEGRMLQLDNFETEIFAVHLEIEACMRDQGLVKP